MIERSGVADLRTWVKGVCEGVLRRLKTPAGALRVRAHRVDRGGADNMGTLRTQRARAIVWGMSVTENVIACGRAQHRSAT